MYWIQSFANKKNRSRQLIDTTRYNHCPNASRAVWTSDSGRTKSLNATTAGGRHGFSHWNPNREKNTQHTNLMLLLLVLGFDMTRVTWCQYQENASQTRGYNLKLKNKRKARTGVRLRASHPNVFCSLSAILCERRRAREKPSSQDSHAKSTARRCTKSKVARIYDIYMMMALLSHYHE